MLAMNYSHDQCQAACEYADTVYRLQATTEEAIGVLTTKHQINEATAKMFIECYARLRRGEVYRRGLAEEATRVFLDFIQSKYGLPGLVVAVQAADSHLAYRRSTGDRRPGLIKLIEAYRSQLTDTIQLLPDEENDQYCEGTRTVVWVSKIERSPAARTKCIEHHGLKCCVCDFSFGDSFGDIGFGFIHVHHLNPISATIAERPVDPIHDLRPICPNCHAMAHRETPPISIERLKSIRAEQASSRS